MKHTITESSFLKYKGDKGIAISLIVPRGWTGKRYQSLAPSPLLLNLWKSGCLEEEDYIEIYKDEVLSHLKPEQVLADLGDGAVLLCWEITGFCHRHLVIKWLSGELE